MTSSAVIGGPVRAALGGLSVSATLAAPQVSGTHNSGMQVRLTSPGTAHRPMINSITSGVIPGCFGEQRIGASVSALSSPSSLLRPASTGMTPVLSQLSNAITNCLGPNESFLACKLATAGGLRFGQGSRMLRTDGVRRSASSASPGGSRRGGFGRRRSVTRAAVATERATSGPAQKFASGPAELLKETTVQNCIIVGSGPAGYTAAIYAARANLKPVCFEGVTAGGVAGGQLMTTTEVENFPGFPEGITGPDLMERMRKQAERWGAELFSEDVEYVDLQNRPFTVRTSEREIQAHTIIIATGATAKRLGLPREHEFWSNGISACAICDGASPIYKGQELAVVGGGDTAAEEAVYLTKYAKHVHLMVRKDHMQASKAMQDRLFTNPNVTVHFNSEVVDVDSNNKGEMNAVVIKHSVTKEEKRIPVRGLFYGIGHQPNSDIVAGQVDLDPMGYVVVKEGSADTSVDGVFAAGDLQDHQWRQAITAAGSGCIAALSAERYLVATGLVVEFHQKVVEEVEKKELTMKDVEEHFDPTLTRHKGQYALRKLYHESPRLLGVLYTSPTCGPCRSLKPILNKVIDEFDSAVHWVEIDIEEDPEIAEAAGVTGTPVVHFFKNKEKIKSIQGVKMKREYRETISAHVS
eukprot:TRINITY_DN12185_c0_g6_i1.p1 TRINITY_DN12185_c0_g6~~TRINITY_DN12185_c0_g6_i1.p1  ORF type:complete len:639 (+),score=100.17 TRINITY_DN12185_c0_g6_i1:689-2605(+)